MCGPDKGDRIASHAWKLTGVATSPDTRDALKSVSDQVVKDLEAVGILPLVEVNAADGGDDDGICEDGETCQYGQILTGGTTAYPYFDAPKVASGIANIRQHDRYNDALAAACTALGTTDFGDSEAALARDECNPEVAQPARGEALPTPG